MFYRFVRWVAVGVFLLPGVVAGQAASVVDTVHNLSASGPGSFRSLDETEVCKFCHVPHNSEPSTPLWGHRLSNASYTVGTLRDALGEAGQLPQPDGSSRLCLSCHDGTVALGEIRGQKRPLRMAGGDRLAPGDPGFLGTDLSGSHPVSFVVTDQPRRSGEMGLVPLDQIRSSATVRLDSNGKLQCTTCHDPHADRFYIPGRVPRFWVEPSVQEVCLTCHRVS